MANQGPSLEDPTVHAVTARVTVQNKSGKRVQVLNSRWAVRGVGESSEASQKEPGGDGSVPAVATDVLGFDRVLDDGYYFEPEEKYVRQLTVPVPSDQLGRCRALRLAVDLHVAKGDRLTLSRGRGAGEEGVDEPGRCRRNLGARCCADH